MALQQVRNCDFGQVFSGSAQPDVGYTLLDVSGSVVSPRTVSGVYSLGSGSGAFGAHVSFPDRFRGHIVWDTGSTFSSTYYAVEEFNVEANNPVVDDNARALDAVRITTSFLYDTQYGRWQIVGNQMIFYKEDNVTEVARFDLLDAGGAPTMDAVFERVRV